MYMSQKTKRTILASVMISGLTLVSSLYPVDNINNENILTPIISVSVAHAETQTYTGVGEYIMQNNQTPDFAIQNAKMYAERNALEQAGIFVSSQTVVKNARLQQDEIQTFTAGVLTGTEVVSIEPIPLSG